jgi:hypothetical protein
MRANVGRRTVDEAGKPSGCITPNLGVLLHMEDLHGVWR